MEFYPKLQETIIVARSKAISMDRQMILQRVVDYVQSKVSKGETAHLNFICTHNSRRSQFSQIWAKAAATYFNVPVQTYSGGVEVTEFNPKAVACLKRQGFQMGTFGKKNPRYKVKYAEGEELILAFSKLYDDPANPSENFAAVMTCGDADKNCPIIPGCEKRISLRYRDPKAFDGTAQEAVKYDERSLQIASEMMHIFKKVSESMVSS